jgi:hypothetical protein
MGLTLGVSALRATPIAVYNTGVDGSGALLPDGAVDPHYQLISSADPAFPGPNAVVVQSQAWPIPPWVANGPNSNWIGPRTDAGVGNLPGTYIYETTFDLTGLDPATSMITGIWTTDNNGLDILLNGVSLGYTTPYDAFSALDSTHYAFTINGGFVPGINTLDFVVFNEADAPPNPTGLRVELSGRDGVPEPATLGLVGLGLLGVGLLRRRLVVR